MPAMSKEADAGSNGETDPTMDYATELQQMLAVIGRYRRPVYVVRSHVVNGCTLTVTEDDEHHQTSYDFEARREGPWDRAEETSRQALLHFARLHAVELAGTVYCLYPAAAPPGATQPVLRPLDGGEDDAVAQLARLALAQASFADRAARELGRTKAALSDARKRIADLEDALYRL